MSTEDIKTKYGLDTTDFKTGISAMNRALRVLNSDFAANAASMGDWSKTASGLEARNNALADMMDVQSVKVAALKSEYERLSTEQGANSAAAQNALIAYNKGQESLNGMQAEVNENQTALADMTKESDSASDSVTELGQKTETAGGQMLTFGQVMDGVKAGLQTAVTVIAGVATALVGVGAAIAGVVLKSAEFADGLVEMSDKTGLSTTRLQELAYVGSQVGVETETIASSMGKLTKSMDQASSQTETFAAKQADATGKIDQARIAYDQIVKIYGEKSLKAKEALEKVTEAETNLAELTNGDTAAAFDQLGVSITDASGSLRDNETVFAEIIDSLGKISNETERDALSMSIFGKSAQELNPLIKAGSEEIANLSAEASKMGAVVSEDNVSALGEFSDTLGGLKLGLQGTATTIGAAILPGFQALGEKGKGYLEQLSTAVTSSNGDVGQMGKNVGNLVLTIIQDITTQLPMLMQTGLQILMSILQGIMAMLPTLLPIAIQIIQSLIEFVVQSLPLLLEAGVQILLAVVNGIVPMLPMLLETAVKIIIMLLEGITAAIPQLIPAITQIIPKIVLLLINNLPLLVNAALQLIVALATGLIQAIPVLVPEIPKIIMAIVSALVRSFFMIDAAARDIVIAMLTAITESLPAVSEKAKEIVIWALDGMASMLGKLSDIGKQIVDGVWSGIKANATKFKDDVKSFFKGIVDAIKKNLGIKSPSTVFAGIGENMALGLGVGFQGAFDDIERNMRGAVNGLSGGLSGAASQSKSGQGMVVNLTAQYPYQSGQSVADTIRLINMLAR